ncbi:MAG: AIR synthase related protein [Eubacterium ramulus]
MCGTVNDLACMGAKPLYLTCAFVIEEGFPMEKLEEIVAAMGKNSKRSWRTYRIRRHKSSRKRSSGRRLYHNHRNGRDSGRCNCWRRAGKTGRWIDCNR